MIPCGSCGNKNPIGTRYCRVCGTKVQVRQEQLFQAVAEDQAILASQRWLERGRSMLLVGLFVLTCALVLRYAIVPPMPQADVPPVDAGSSVPDVPTRTAPR